MCEYFRRGDTLWQIHGGKETLRDFERSFSESEMGEYIEWVSNLPLVYEDDMFVYKHAGLNPFEPIEKQSREIL
ncbi:hypothetical protein GCM10008022_12970 [Paenibacillus hunanensis]|uniref:Uncharacterized protein n=1 Tax=Paenibacillus hunanensis TaxID=539262 RepID=A0ABU1J2X4_9BACL|nr:hypothetical protein [Paenibacillus hunanensis]GGJ05326.1 hypothetical protein GCM10008022_12970 [Paenibacillus hunanensis]